MLTPKMYFSVLVHGWPVATPSVMPGMVLEAPELPDSGAGHWPVLAPIELISAFDRGSPT
ncbi:hypothetical protein A5790_14565 [Mycobacterium sp. 852002-51152_SCH6134967]|nr:hypothetical protein A5790_14565 [Mycobacterium sp. 852002-51152_SCH6134967]